MTRDLLLKSSRVLALVLSTLTLAAVLPAPMARAYNYAPVQTEPLLDGREALFQAAESGFWTAAKFALQSMRPEIDYLDQNEDPGLAAAFDDAVAAKDAEALRSAFNRAASDEILRRLTGARDNFDNYESAKLLVVAANLFYTAVAADLEPQVSAIIAEQMPMALDAIGNPGVLGVGRRAPDPAAFATARSIIAEALGLDAH